MSLCLPFIVDFHVHLRQGDFMPSFVPAIRKATLQESLIPNKAIKARAVKSFHRIRIKATHHTVKGHIDVVDLLDLASRKSTFARPSFF